MKTFLQEYNACNMVQQCLPDMSGSDQCSGYWELDARMRKVFNEYIKQYEQGLIHSMELVQGLVREINLPRKD